MKGRSLIMILWLILTIISNVPNTVYAQNTHRDSTEFKIYKHDLGYNAITTTPFTIPQGSLVYQNLFLGINTLEYGVTDRLSIASGISLFGLNSDDGPTGLFFAKYNLYNTDNFVLSISSLSAVNRYNSLKDYTGEKIKVTDIHTALFLNAASIRDANNYITYGLGYYSLYGEGSVIFTAGFCKRLSESIAFIGDLWLPLLNLDSNSRLLLPIPALGFRYFAKSGITVDFGFPFIGLKIPILKP